MDLPPPSEASIRQAASRTFSSDEAGNNNNNNNNNQITDNPQLHSAPAPQHVHVDPHHHLQSYPPPQDVWSGAISRLQTQVTYNTSMVDAHRRDVSRVEHAVGRLQQEMAHVLALLNDIRTELNVLPSRPRSGDAQRRRGGRGVSNVIAEQLDSVSDKANEVDGLKMQLELMKRRMKHLEHQGSPSTASHPLEATGSARRESSGPGQAPTTHHRQQHSHLQHHQALPPMRTASVASSAEIRQQNYHHAVGHDPQAESALFMHPTAPHSGHPSASASASVAHAAYPRPDEPLPPPSAMAGWRVAEGQAQAVHAQSMPPPPTAPTHGSPTELQASGWAAVNASQPHKRPFDDRPLQPGESPGSPKRPRLAPIMPRSGHQEDSYGPLQSPYHPLNPGTTVTSDPAHTTRHWPYSGESAHQVHPTITSTIPSAQGLSASTSSYRSIPSMGQVGNQGPWMMAEPEQQQLVNTQEIRPAHGPGSRGGRVRTRGRGRGRGRSRGSGNESSLQDETRPRTSTPEWEKVAGWTGSRTSPNGYYTGLPLYSPSTNHMRQPTAAMHSPAQNLHESQTHRPLDPTSVLPPNTPMLPVHPNQAFRISTISSSGETTHAESKKSRTKPTRNAEGILIRKDGRPDMRSVSSANNLRKVHAKKEAERTETEGRGGSAGLEGEGGEGEGGVGGGGGGGARRSGLSFVSSTGKGSEEGAEGTGYDTPDVEGEQGEGEDVEAEAEGESEEGGQGPTDKQRDLAAQTLQQRYFPDPLFTLTHPSSYNENPTPSHSRSQSGPTPAPPQKLPEDEEEQRSEKSESSKGPSQIPVRPPPLPPPSGPGREGLSMEREVWTEESGAAAGNARAREEYRREQERWAEGWGNE
ncbi:hypothetical protein MBLNU230_g4341t1 [Neophaeotheca triangularis]